MVHSDTKELKLIARKSIKDSRGDEENDKLNLEAELSKTNFWLADPQSFDSSTSELFATNKTR